MGRVHCRHQQFIRRETPLFIGNAVDTIKHGVDSGSLQYSKLIRDAGLIVGFSIVAGFMTFLTRQTIIVVSRKIEYDLRTTFLHTSKNFLSIIFRIRPPAI